VTLPAVAVSVTGCAVETAVAVAVKLADVAPEETVTDRGTETLALLLDRPTLSPALDAAVLSDTEQESVTEPVSDAFVHVMPVSVGTTASRVKEKFSVTLPAVALNVEVWVVLTPVTVAEKLALEEPAGTVTVEGTETAELLLERLTVKPPVAAAAFSVTPQESVPEPVIDALVQVKPVSTGTPVPLRLTAFEDEESLPIVSCPATAPAIEGSNCTVSWVEEPGLKVMGSVGGVTVKPVPETVTELMVTAAAPVEFTVTVCVTGVLTFTLPKVRPVALRVSEGLASSTSISVVSEAPPALAVRITFWVEVTADAVA
jgi:hypothetical protein